MAEAAPASVADHIVRKLAVFGRLLRAGGAEVGGNRIPDALEALAAVDVASRDECYWALRCTLVSRRQDIEVFDAAFAGFWLALPAHAGEEADGRTPAEPDGGPPDLSAPPRQEEAGPDRAPIEAGVAERSDEADDAAAEVGTAWSAVDRLREMDFAEYSDQELQAARRLMADLADAMPRRRSRRLRAARDGHLLDKRRTLQSAMRTDGYPLERYWRRALLVPRRVVFVVDISGSMAVYARAMIMFLQASVRAGSKVEAFAFGTRLTRITPHLRAHEPDRAMQAATQAVPDWAGGTRIGDNLKALNDGWARRGMTRGAVVVVLSDGWERGDAGALASEMERLSRAAHTMIWVNPLAGEPGYEPLAQGMAAALPYVDHFLPGHDLRSLERLADVLRALPQDRARHASRTPGGLG